ncbi:MAG: hypothetical protein AAF851_00375 [Myxococcota bacterium]
MQVQIITAPTRQKALENARRRVGGDPLVLSVKRRKGAAGKVVWEAMVAQDGNPLQPSEPSPAELIPWPVQNTLSSQDEPGTAPVVLGHPGEVEPPVIDLHQLDGFRDDLRRLRAKLASGAKPNGDLLALAHRLTLFEGDLLRALLQGREMPERWHPILERLGGAGYPREDALRILTVLADRVTPDHEGLLEAELRALISQGIEVAPSDERVRPALVVFAGGTGVGKTTLAAKLAADLGHGGGAPPILGVLRPRKGSGTAIVRHCARTLGLGYVEAYDAEDVRALAERAQRQPIILDSSSVNPNSAASMEGLAESLSRTPNVEVHAVVPASQAAEDTYKTLTAFSMFRRLRMSVTRLDESPWVGRVLSASSRSRTPIGYLSLGPRIPDDLARPTVDHMVDSVVSFERTVA